MVAAILFFILFRLQIKLIEHNAQEVYALHAVRAL